MISSLVDLFEGEQMAAFLFFQLNGKKMSKKHCGLINVNLLFLLIFVISGGSR